MAVGTQRVDFGPRVETNLYLKRARKMGKSLITASTQRTDFNLMDVLQQMEMSRVVAEQQKNTYPQVIGVQRIDFDLMAKLQ